MIKQITKALAGPLAVLALLFAPALLLAPSVSAQYTNQGELNDAFCGGSEFAVPPGGGDTFSGTECDPDITTEGFQNTVNNIVNLISFIVGAIAVVMIIYGGFRYITSGGDPGKVTSAKNTILYGLIGLVIVAVAQIITKFVLQYSSDTFG